MKSFATLLRVQALALLNSLSPNAQSMPRKQRAQRLALVGVGVVLLAALGMFYMATLGIGLASMGAGEAIPTLAVIMGSLAGVFFTFMKARGTLFGFSDYDLVMALPISLRTVVLSRMATLFGAAIAIAFVFMVPLYAVYFIVVGGNLAQIVFALMSMMLAPLAPTAVAAFASYAVTALASRFRHANIAYFILGMVLLLAVLFGSMVFSFQMSTDAEQKVAALAELSAGLQAAIADIYPPAAWAGSAVAHMSVVHFALFAVFSLGITGVCTEIMQRFFLALNGALANSTSKNTRREDIVATAHSPWMAIVKKELQALIGIPTYAFNCMLGYLFMIGIGVVIAIADPQEFIATMGDELALSGTSASQGLSFTFLLIPWVFAFCGIMCDSAACSISIEGRAAWIMSVAPLSTRKILSAKFASCAVPTAFSLAISLAVLLLTGSIDALCALEVALLGFGMFHLWINVGMALDANTPNFSWTSPNEIVKRGMPVTVAIVGGMICIALFAVLVLAVIAPNLGFTAAHVVNIVLGAVFLLIGQMLFLHTTRSTLPFCSR